MQTLWIPPSGTLLGEMQRMCIQSFLDHGHTYHVYSYSAISNIPAGAVLMDANTILPETEIYRYKTVVRKGRPPLAGSVAAFSNYFRFVLLYKNGGCWVDADIACIKPILFSQGIVIATEPDSTYTSPHVTSFFLKLPRGSPEALAGMKIQRYQKKLILAGKVTWSSGPRTVKKIVQRFNLKGRATTSPAECLILPWRAMCSCNFSHFKSLIFPSARGHRLVSVSLATLPSQTVGIHLWHERWRRNGLCRSASGSFHPRSIYVQLCVKHLQRRTPLIGAPRKCGKEQKSSPAEGGDKENKVMLDPSTWDRENKVLPRVSTAPTATQTDKENKVPLDVSTAGGEHVTQEILTGHVDGTLESLSNFKNNCEILGLSRLPGPHRNTDIL